MRHGASSKAESRRLRKNRQPWKLIVAQGDAKGTCREKKPRVGPAARQHKAHPGGEACHSNMQAGCRLCRKHAGRGALRNWAQKNGCMRCEMCSRAAPSCRIWRLMQPKRESEADGCVIYLAYERLCAWLHAEKERRPAIHRKTPGQGRGMERLDLRPTDEKYGVLWYTVFTSWAT